VKFYLRNYQVDTRNLYRRVNLPFPSNVYYYTPDFDYTNIGTSFILTPQWYRSSTDSSVIETYLNAKNPSNFQVSGPSTSPDSDNNPKIGNLNAFYMDGFSTWGFNYLTQSGWTNAGYTAPITDYTTFKNEVCNQIKINSALNSFLSGYESMNVIIEILPSGNPRVILFYPGNDPNADEVIEIT